MPTTNLKPITAPKKGLQYSTFGKAMEAFTANRDAVKSDWKKAVREGRAKGIIRLPKPYILGLPNNENLGDYMGYATMKNLKSAILQLEEKYPNTKIDIVIEGRFDWFEDYQAMFAGDYEPSDEFAEVLVYKNYL